MLQRYLVPTLRAEENLRVLKEKLRREMRNPGEGKWRGGEERKELHNEELHNNILVLSVSDD